MNQCDDGVGGQTTPDSIDSGGSPNFWEMAHETFEQVATHRPLDAAWMVEACQFLDAVGQQLTDGFGRRTIDFTLNATAYFPICRAAHQGNRYAQYVLARYYQTGIVLPDDPRAAVDALDAAAQQGDDGAKHAMDQIELAGPNTESARSSQTETPVAWPNLAAAYWLERAANQGLASAQEELAWMYFKGLGVPIDYVAAYMWSNLSGTATCKDRAVNPGRSVCFELKMHKFASFEQIAEAQRLTRKFVPKSEKQESE